MPVSSRSLREESQKIILYPQIKGEGTKGKCAHHEPVRTCIVCRRRQYKRELIRLVLQDDVVIVDKRKRLPGRGAYVCDNGRCLEFVLGNYRGCLNRAFKTGSIRQYKII